ncbi:MAG: hypothetical protein AVDCRST_MAG85-1303, partial [uncultured Solirubrobacteraceae bacterium]
APESRSRHLPRRVVPDRRGRGRGLRQRRGRTGAEDRPGLAPAARHPALGLRPRRRERQAHDARRPQGQAGRRHVPLLDLRRHVPGRRAADRRRARPARPRRPRCRDRGRPAPRHARSREALPRRAAGLRPHPLPHRPRARAAPAVARVRHRPPDRRARAQRLRRAARPHRSPAHRLPRRQGHAGRHRERPGAARGRDLL